MAYPDTVWNYKRALEHREIQLSRWRERQNDLAAQRRNDAASMTLSVVVTTILNIGKEKTKTAVEVDEAHVHQQVNLWFGLPSAGREFTRIDALRSYDGRPLPERKAEEIDSRLASVEEYLEKLEYI